MRTCVGFALPPTVGTESRTCAGFRIPLCSMVAPLAGTRTPQAPAQPAKGFRSRYFLEHSSLPAIPLAPPACAASARMTAAQAWRFNAGCSRLRRATDDAFGHSSRKATCRLATQAAALGKTAAPASSPSTRRQISRCSDLTRRCVRTSFRSTSATRSPYKAKIARVSSQQTSPAASYSAARSASSCRRGAVISMIIFSASFPHTCQHAALAPGA
jgi:hypothetical protein